jgi:hypothetical protein
MTIQQLQPPQLLQENRNLRQQVVGLIAENNLLRAQAVPPVAPVPLSMREGILRNDADSSGLLLLAIMKAAKMPSDGGLTAKDLPVFVSGLVVELEKLRKKVKK